MSYTAKLPAACGYVSMQRAEFEVFLTIWASATAGHGSRFVYTVIFAVDQPLLLSLFRSFFLRPTCSTSSILIGYKYKTGLLQYTSETNYKA
jgi:hypothetical protein